MINSILDETGTLPDDLPKAVSPETAAANPDVQNIISPPTHDAHGDCEQLSPDDHGQHRQRAVRNSLDLQADSELDEGEDFAKGGRTAEERSANRVFSQRKYPEATDYAICSLIGGFFFLRFINPAIVTPQAYMLIDSLPTSAKHPRRTLTLVRRAVEKLRVMAC